MLEKCTCSKCGHTFVPSFVFDFYPEPTKDNPNAGICENCMLKEALSRSDAEMVSVPREYETTVCKRGQGAITCCFLAVGPVGPVGEVGYACLKKSSLEANIRVKLRNGTMLAKGDNCSGPPDFNRK